MYRPVSSIPRWSWPSWARKLGSAAGAVVIAAAAQAGTATYNFDTDPATTLTFEGNNIEPWQPAGGNPATGGFLAITYPEGNQYTGVVFPDLDPGKIVTAFKFECDLRVGNSTGDRAADGFSVSFARGSDPLLTDLANTANFAGSVPEAGSTTGIAVSFDTWSGNALPDGADIEGIIVRVDNKTVLRKALATRHGACDDITSLQTGPRDAQYWADFGDPHLPESWATLCWQPFSIELDAAGKLTVKYKNATILDQFQTTYFPTAGRLVLAGRTGGANEHTHVDNLRLTTEAVTDSSPPTAPSNLAASIASTRGVVLTWAAGSDDSGRVAYEVERDGTVITSTPITATTFTDLGLKPNTTYSYKVRSTDPGNNKSAFTAALSVKTAVETLTPTVGFATFQAYTGITGTPVDNLFADPKYPDSPDIIGYATALDTRTVFPDDSHENYGGRMFALLTPTQSGDYEFFLRSDDASQLYLSTDDKRPNLALIAEETGCCAAFQESGDPRTSAPITLTAGRKYLIEVVWKEGGGGDFAQVAWRRSGDTTAASALRPIPGSFLTTDVDAAHGNPVITGAPSFKDAKLGATATATVEVGLGEGPFTYQWFFNGTEIQGATSKDLALQNLSVANVGSYSVRVSNPFGSATSQEAVLIPDGSLFIEAEDFDFDGGKYVTDKPIGMTGPYAGGAYQDLGSEADLGIDWNTPNGAADNAAQPYRPGTGVAAGKMNAHASGIPRGSFDVAVNHVVGWNDGGDWYNYTRKFPDTAADYNVIGRLSSGGNPINGQLDEVTAGRGTANQTLKKLGVFSPGRATAGWDSMEFFPLTDDAGAAAKVNLGGERTLRFTTLPGANLDIDYMIFIPAATGGGATLADVTAPGDTITSFGGPSPGSGNENVENAINNVTQKYLNFGSDGNTTAGFTGPVGLIVTPAVGSTIVTGLRLYTANDSEVRDPADYILEGSNDGTTFTQISAGPLALPAGRNPGGQIAIDPATHLNQTVTFANTTAYTTYRLTFTNVKNNATANSMQIAEIELLGEAAATGPRLSVALAANGTSVTLSWTGAGTLQEATAVTGPWTDVTGATGTSHTAQISGNAKFYRLR